MIEITPITVYDIQECARLYVKVFNGEPWNDAWTDETAYNRLFEIFSMKGFVGVKYSVDNQMIGAAFGHLEQWFKGNHCCLKEMYVDNTFQGKGVGSSILKALEELLLRYDVETIYLFTSKGNKTHEFYLKNGYENFDSMTMMGKEIH